MPDSDRPSPAQLDLSDGHLTPLPADGNGLQSCHVFDEDSIEAVNTALAAQRALLLLGEPGTGKSQVARAVAEQFGWPLHKIVVDARTEARDFKWRYDAVARLAEAQMAGAMLAGAVASPPTNTADASAADCEALLGGAHDRIQSKLDEANFLDPGVLWWAFDREGACEQAKTFRQRRKRGRDWQPPAAPHAGTPRDGTVVLIDEIDKADPDVPNGLLEALGDGSFETMLGDRVSATPLPMLIVVTSNGERALPGPFVRRCIVHELSLPTTESAFVERLGDRVGKAHFPGLSQGVRRKAAKLLFAHRKPGALPGHGRAGQAEYLDLLRVVAGRYPTSERQERALEKLQRFVFAKFDAEVEGRGGRRATNHAR